MQNTFHTFIVHTTAILQRQQESTYQNEILERIEAFSTGFGARIFWSRHRFMAAKKIYVQFEHNLNATKPSGIEYLLAFAIKFLLKFTLP